MLGSLATNGSLAPAWRLTDGEENRAPETSPALRVSINGSAALTNSSWHYPIFPSMQPIFRCTRDHRVHQIALLRKSRSSSLFEIHVITRTYPSRHYWGLSRMLPSQLQPRNPAPIPSLECNANQEQDPPKAVILLSNSWMALVLS